MISRIGGYAQLLPGGAVLTPNHMKSVRIAIASVTVGLALALTGCQTRNLGLEDTGNVPQTAQPTPNPNGDVFGSGPVRISMLLPSTAPGNAAAVAAELRNGALMALRDFGDGALELVIKDTAGQAASAQAAASEAVREGAIAVLGPVFAANVSAASAITQPTGRTMIAFSTDSSVARRGVYLLSYTPQDDTTRAIRYTLSLGKRSFLAFLPANAEGSIREAILRQEIGAAGATLQVLKYERTTESITQAVTSSQPLVEAADTIYIPEGGEIPNVILQTMRRSAINTVGKLIVGSGTWESVKLSEPQLDGAIYPGRDTTNFESFSSRYESTNGAKPSVWASLGYDSVTLAVDLVKRLGPQQAFTPQSLENPRGFAGINGVFRLRQDGTTERGLAIYQVREGAAVMAVPAPTSFARGS